MDFGNLVNALLLIVVAGIGSVLLGRRLDRLEGRIDRLVTREEFEARVGRLETEVAAIRSDLTQIALAIGARPRPQTG